MREQQPTLMISKCYTNRKAEAKAKLTEQNSAQHKQMFSVDRCVCLWARVAATLRRNGLEVHGMAILGT